MQGSHDCISDLKERVQMLEEKDKKQESDIKDLKKITSVE